MINFADTSEKSQIDLKIIEDEIINSAKAKDGSKKVILNFSWENPKDKKLVDFYRILESRNWEKDENLISRWYTSFKDIEASQIVKEIDRNVSNSAVESRLSKANRGKCFIDINGLHIKYLEI